MASEKQAVEDENTLPSGLRSENQGKSESTLLFSATIIPFTLGTQSGTDQLFNQLIRPRLRTFLMDTYKDVSYTLDDEGYSASEQQNIVRKRFIKNWEDIMQGLKVCKLCTSRRGKLNLFCFAGDDGRLQLSNSFRLGY